MKTSAKKRIWICIALIFVMATTSFAWFFEDTVLVGKTLDLRYKFGIIDPEELSCELWIPDGEDGYKKVTDFGEVLKYGIVPNQTANFKIRLYNKSSQPQKASLALSNIKITIDPVPMLEPAAAPPLVSEQEYKECCKALLDGMFFGCRSVGGVYNKGNVQRPGNVYIRFSDASYDSANGTYTLTIMDNIYFPPTQEFEDPALEDEYAELNCYIYFDRNAGEGINLMEMTMDMHELEILR